MWLSQAARTVTITPLCFSHKYMGCIVRGKSLPLVICSRQRSSCRWAWSGAAAELPRDAYQKQELWRKYSHGDNTAAALLSLGLCWCQLSLRAAQKWPRHHNQNKCHSRADRRTGFFTLTPSAHKYSYCVREGTGQCVTNNYFLCSCSVFSGLGRLCFSNSLTTHILWVAQVQNCVSLTLPRLHSCRH